MPGCQSGLSLTKCNKQSQTAHRIASHAPICRWTKIDASLNQLGSISVNNKTHNNNNKCLNARWADEYLLVWDDRAQLDVVTTCVCPTMTPLGKGLAGFYAYNEAIPPMRYWCGRSRDKTQAKHSDQRTGLILPVQADQSQTHLSQGGGERVVGAVEARPELGADAARQLGGTQALDGVLGHLPLPLRGDGGWVHKRYPLDYLHKTQRQQDGPRWSSQSCSPTLSTGAVVYHAIILCCSTWGCGGKQIDSWEQSIVILCLLLYVADIHVLTVVLTCLTCSQTSLVTEDPEWKVTSTW